MDVDASLEIRILNSEEHSLLENVAPGVFDKPVVTAYSVEFLNDARHHLTVALDFGLVVGMASAVHYVHPDKAPEMWINEIGVAPAYRSKGTGKRLLRVLFDRAITLGCREAWVLTDRRNTAAIRLYESAGGRDEREETVLYSFRLRK